MFNDKIAIENLEYFNTLVRLKKHDILQDGFCNISRQDIVKYLNQVVWKRKEYVSLNDMVDDILSLDGSVVFEFLANEAIVLSKEKNLSDFDALFNL